MPILEEMSNDNYHEEAPQIRRHYRGEIRCANSGEVFHPSTDIHTSGFYSHKLELWFGSTYDYNEYCFNNRILRI